MGSAFNAPVVLRLVRQGLLLDESPAQVLPLFRRRLVDLRAGMSLPTDPRRLSQPVSRLFKSLPQRAVRQLDIKPPHVTQQGAWL